LSNGLDQFLKESLVVSVFELVDLRFGLFLMFCSCLSLATQLLFVCSSVLKEANRFLLMDLVVCTISLCPQWPNVKIDMAECASLFATMVANFLKNCMPPFTFSV
jgi:hypothetical protein